MVRDMTDRRRLKGTLVQPVETRWKIESDTKEFIDSMARNAGISSSYMVELIAKHVPLNDRGLPEWYTTPENVRERPSDVA
jgi:hypothetical protein